MGFLEMELTRQDGFNVFMPIYCGLITYCTSNTTRRSCPLSQNANTLPVTCKEQLIGLWLPEILFGWVAVVNCNMHS